MTTAEHAEHAEKLDHSLRSARTRRLAPSSDVTRSSRCDDERPPRRHEGTRSKLFFVFSRLRGCISSMPIVYKGKVFSVEVERKRFPNGQEHEVAVVRHPPSVVLIPVQDDGRVVLIRQFRPSIGRELWELPAGSLDEGESAAAAAARECEEEIGRAPHKVERLRGLF